MTAWSASAVALTGQLPESRSCAEFSVLILFGFTKPPAPNSTASSGSVGKVGKADTHICRAPTNARRCAGGMASGLNLQNSQTSQCGRYYPSYFADKESGAQRGSETCPRLHSQKSDHYFPRQARVFLSLPARRVALSGWSISDHRLPLCDTQRVQGALRGQ